MIKLLTIIAVVAFGGVSASEKADTVRIKALLEASASLQRSNIDSCMLTAREALSLSEKSGYLYGIRGAYMRIGSVYMTRGLNDSAIAYITAALQISNDTKDWRKTAGAYILLSYIYQTRGQQDSAFNSVYNALHYGEIANDNYVINQAYIALGDLFYHYEDYDNALTYFNLALKSAIENNDSYTHGSTLISIGNVLYKQKKITNALEIYLQVDSIFRADEDEIGTAQNLMNLALCYGDLKIYNKAFKYYEEAILFYKKLGMKREEANVYFNISTPYIETGALDKAIEYLNKAIEISGDVNDLFLTKVSLNLLSKAYSKMGDYKNAYLSHVQYSTLSDSMLNSEKITRISEMQARYDSELKEREIAILNQKNINRTNQRNAFIGGVAILMVFLVIVARQRNKVSKERQRSDQLLLNILPNEIAQELKDKGKASARSYEKVSILFSDFIGFTQQAAKLSPAELVDEINHCFEGFDLILDKYSVEKIKTIGDAYMAAGGIPAQSENSAVHTVLAALEMQEFIIKRKWELDEKGLSGFDMRVGIHTGPVVAGVVGVKKFQYDMWGDAVNTASRIESNGEAGKVNISNATFEIIKDYPLFEFTERGKIEAKGKGEIEMYFVSLR